MLNKKSYFNNFGLGKEDNQIYYYPNYQSFYDRINRLLYILDKVLQMFLYNQTMPERAYDKRIVTHILI
jgi:hypothetical protein